MGVENHLRTACLVAAVMLAAGCSETAPKQTAPKETAGKEVASNPVIASGSWEEIPKAPTANYRPEAAFWIENQLVVVAGSTIEAWDPKRGAWTVVAEIPQAEECEGCGYSEVAVWTGERILLWGGGFSYQAPDGSAHSGVAVDIEGNMTPVPEAPIRSRWWHTAVWTGEEMIVWGGTCGRHECRDGAAYDPRTDSWRRIAEAPVPGYAHGVVWTGQEMIVWGGSDDSESEGMKGCVTSFVDDGAAYDPTTDSWRVVAESPIDARGWHSAVWTGAEMIVWGGATGFGCNYGYGDDGAAYDPTSDSWRPIASSPLSGRVEATSVWTGTEMLVWGGSIHGRSVTLDDGAVFDPSSDEWTMLPEAPLKSRAMHVGIWTGDRMIVWGGCCNETSRSIDSFSDGATFLPN